MSYLDEKDRKLITELLLKTKEINELYNDLYVLEMRDVKESDEYKSFLETLKYALYEENVIYKEILEQFKKNDDKVDEYFSVFGFSTNTSFDGRGHRIPYIDINDDVAAVQNPAKSLIVDRILNRLTLITNKMVEDKYKALKVKDYKSVMVEMAMLKATHEDIIERLLFTLDDINKDFPDETILSIYIYRLSFVNQSAEDYLVKNNMYVADYCNQRLGFFTGNNSSENSRKYASCFGATVQRTTDFYIDNSEDAIYDDPRYAMLSEAIVRTIASLIDKEAYEDYLKEIKDRPYLADDTDVANGKDELLDILDNRHLDIKRVRSFYTRKGFIDGYLQK